MRVIHKDGRMGTIPSTELPDAVWTWPDWDGERLSCPVDAVRVSDLRPLGPVEEELRRSEWDLDVGLNCYDWSEDACSLWAYCHDSLGCEWDEGQIDADSEAVEAAEALGL